MNKNILDIQKPVDWESFIHDRDSDIGSHLKVALNLHPAQVIVSRVEKSSLKAVLCKLVACQDPEVGMACLQKCFQKKT